jgi:hypothetical protein
MKNYFMQKLFLVLIFLCFTTCNIYSFAINNSIILDSTIVKVEVTKTARKSVAQRVKDFSKLESKTNFYDYAGNSLSLMLAGILVSIPALLVMLIGGNVAIAIGLVLAIISLLFLALSYLSWIVSIIQYFKHRHYKGIGWQIAASILWIYYTVVIIATWYADK